MSKQKNIELHLPAGLEYSAIVRHLSQSFFEMNGFNKVWCSRLKLVVDELFMNAVRYGSSADDPVHLHFQSDDEQIMFSIQDHGTGRQKIYASDLLDIMHHNEANTQITSTSGRGLALITKLWADRCEILDSSYGGIAIIFYKKKAREVMEPPTPQIQISTPAAPLISKAMPHSSASAASTPADLSHPDEPPRPSYTLSLQGEIDQYNIEEKVHAVQDVMLKLPDHALFLIDCRELSYINSTFIGHLADWYNQLQQRDIQLKIVRANAAVRDILDLVGLTRVFDVS